MRRERTFVEPARPRRRHDRRCWASPVAPASQLRPRRARRPRRRRRPTPTAAATVAPATASPHRHRDRPPVRPSQRVTARPPDHGRRRRPSPVSRCRTSRPAPARSSPSAAWCRPGRRTVRGPGSRPGSTAGGPLRRLEGATTIDGTQGRRRCRRRVRRCRRSTRRPPGPTSTRSSFTSADGRAWRRAPDQASLRGRSLVDVVARPAGGWLAVGSEAVPTVFMGIDTWTSADGLAWTLVDAMPQVGAARGVTSFNGGFITWGTDCLDVCGPPERAALWRTTDGATWVRVPAQPSLANAQVDEIIETPTGALAVGETFDADGNATGYGLADASTAPPGRRSRCPAARGTVLQGHLDRRGLRDDRRSPGRRRQRLGHLDLDRRGDVDAACPNGDVRAGSFDIVTSDRRRDRRRSGRAAGGQRVGRPAARPSLTATGSEARTRAARPTGLQSRHARPDDAGHPHRARLDGRDGGPGRRPVRRLDPAGGAELPDLGRADAARLPARPGARQAGRRRDERRARPARSGRGRGDRRRRPRGGRRRPTTTSSRSTSTRPAPAPRPTRT